MLYDRWAERKGLRGGGVNFNSNAVSKHPRPPHTRDAYQRRSLDDLLPLFLYVLVRAQVPGLVCIPYGPYRHVAYLGSGDRNSNPPQNFSLLKGILGAELLEGILTRLIMPIAIILGHWLLKEANRARLPTQD